MNINALFSVYWFVTEYILPSLHLARIPFVQIARPIHQSQIYQIETWNLSNTPLSVQ